LNTHRSALGALLVDLKPVTNQLSERVFLADAYCLGRLILSSDYQPCFPGTWNRWCRAHVWSSLPHLTLTQFSKTREHDSR